MKSFQSVVDGSSGRGAPGRAYALRAHPHNFRSMDSQCRSLGQKTAHPYHTVLSTSAHWLDLDQRISPLPSQGVRGSSAQQNRRIKPAGSQSVYKSVLSCTCTVRPYSAKTKFRMSREGGSCMKDDEGRGHSWR